ncbi:MAG: ADP-forming succinate--CoA ligase subunit beta [Acidimicrobiales bacterium]
MDLYEYEGKSYLARFGVPVGPGAVADSVDEAVAAADAVGYPAVIKAQVRVGGRGKAGGVRIVAGKEEAAGAAGEILGLTISGHRVERLWVEAASPVAREYYVSYTLDRAAKLDLAMVSAQGGIEIEEVAASRPEAIARLEIDPTEGLSAAGAADLVTRAGIDSDAKARVIEVVVALYRCYIEGDADLVEINPLVLLPSGAVRALDAKVTLDDEAAFRHPEWSEFAGAEPDDPRERAAREKGLSYVGLDGSVGIVANGAGLAMSTLDMVNQVGGSAANFLDIGGGADAEVISAALGLVNSDAGVRAILVNVFGGIVRCDEVARGVVGALARVAPASPLVVRLDGTHAAEAHEILRPHLSDRLIVEETMAAAARRAVEIAAAAGR